MGKTDKNLMHNIYPEDVAALGMHHSDFPLEENLMHEIWSAYSFQKQSPWNLPQLWSHRWTALANDWAVLGWKAYPFLPATIFL